MLAAGRAAGLTDVKVARFSETHTALKFVVPRGPGGPGGPGRRAPAPGRSRRNPQPRARAGHAAPTLGAAAVGRGPIKTRRGPAPEPRADPGT